MREIKFRAWHFKTNTMFSPEEMATDQMTLLPTGYFINVHGTSTKLSEIHPHESMLPMQYTGLKDKNGKEIYEGDIIETFHYVRGVVEFHSNVRAAFVAINPKIKEGPNNVDMLGCAVIGNIYENNDLLK